MNVLETVRETIQKTSTVPLPSSDTVSLFERGIIDSFGILELVASLEAALGVSVPDADLIPSRFETVAKIVAYFQERLRPCHN